MYLYLYSKTDVIGLLKAKNGKKDLFVYKYQILFMTPEIDLQDFTLVYINLIIYFYIIIIKYIPTYLLFFFFWGF